MRAPVLLALFAGCLAAAPAARAQWTVEMMKCADVSFMGPELAIEYCTRAIKSGELSNRAYGTAYYNRAIAYGRKGNLEKALADLSEAIRYEAIRPEPDSWRSVTFTSRGVVYAVLRRFDPALADFDEALLLDPTRADIYVHRGQIWLAKRDADRAIAAFTEALRRDIGDRSFYSGVGMTLRDQRRSRDRTTHDSVARLGLGQAYLIKGNAAMAMVEFDNAIRINPANPVFFAQRGFTRQERGDLDGAIADYSEVLRLNPKDAGD